MRGELKDKASKLKSKTSGKKSWGPLPASSGGDGDARGADGPGRRRHVRPHQSSGPACSV